MSKIIGNSKTSGRPEDKDISTIFNQAIALHQQGQMSAAKALYEQIISRKPQHSNAVRLLGLAHKEMGNFEASEANFTKAIRLQPNYCDAYYNRGNLYHQLGRFSAALADYERAIKFKPNFLEALMDRATALKDLGEYDRAIAGYNKLLHINPLVAEAYYNKGVTYITTKALNLAIASFEKAISIKPEYAEAHYQLGLILQELGEFSAAADSYQIAIRLIPNLLIAYLNRGVCLAEGGDYTAAISNFDHAIEIQPDFFEAYINRGVTHRRYGHADAAVASHQAAIRIRPDEATAHYNLGVALQDLRRFNEAIPAYAEAIRLRSNYTLALLNIGLSHAELLDFKEAISYYNQAIDIDKNYVDAYWNKALALLSIGDYSEGWKLYEWGLGKADMRGSKRNLTQALLTSGTAIDGKRIYLYPEQGFGDTIQFYRYVKEIKSRGAHVILEAPPALFDLFNGLRDVDTLVSAGMDIPHFDLHCPLLSLPSFCHTDLNTIPSPDRYLQADTHKVAKWSSKLGERTKLRIGLAWSSVSVFRNDKWRSMAFEDLQEILPPDKYDLICLQKEVKDVDKESFSKRPDIRFFGNDLSDFSETAALIENLDLVISTCTSIPHLGAALGKPTWVMLAHSADWRWLLDREDSPWYESIKLYRQKKDGDWDSVLSRVVHDLERIHLPALE